MQNEILIQKITDRWEITCGTRNSQALLIWDFNEYPDRAQFTQLRKADFILEQIRKIGTVLSPLLSTIRHQFKTLQYPDIKRMNENL